MKRKPRQESRVKRCRVFACDMARDLSGSGRGISLTQEMVERMGNVVIR